MKLGIVRNSVRDSEKLVLTHKEALLSLNTSGFFIVQINFNSFYEQFFLATSPLIAKQITELFLQPSSQRGQFPF